MLSSIYQSHDYPLLYTHLVGDANSVANDRLRVDYNFGGYPTGFFDGGAGVETAYPQDWNYREHIEDCGDREVPDLDLKVALEWLGAAELRVTVAVGFHGSANAAPDSLWLSGEILASPGAECSFEVSCADAEADAVLYQIDWGNGVSTWEGPFAAGEVQKFYHAWSQAGVYGVRVRAKDFLGDVSEWSSPQSILINTLPGRPVLAGPESGVPDSAYTFDASAADADSHELLYQWDWNGGLLEPLMGPYESGAVCSATRAFDADGIYSIRVRARDELGSWSLWSTPLTVTIASSCCAVPADVNDNGVGPDVSDLVYLVNFMFKQGPEAPCFEQADINGSTALDIADLVYLVNYMFKSGPAPLPCP